MAFGGVPTGIMKPQDAASASGSARTMGSAPIETATAPPMGTSVAALAVLLVSSVNRIMIAVAADTTTSSGQLDRLCSASAIHVDNPEPAIADARLRPPPKSRS